LITVFKSQKKHQSNVVMSTECRKTCCNYCSRDGQV